MYSEYNFKIIGYEIKKKKKVYFIMFVLVHAYKFKSFTLKIIMYVNLK